MGYNKENYIRIRQEYADKNLRAKEAAEARIAAVQNDDRELMIASAKLQRALVRINVKH